MKADPSVAKAFPLTAFPIWSALFPTWNWPKRLCEMGTGETLPRNSYPPLHYSSLASLQFQTCQTLLLLESGLLVKSILGGLVSQALGSGLVKFSCWDTLHSPLCAITTHTRPFPYQWLCTGCLCTWNTLTFSCLSSKPKLLVTCLWEKPPRTFLSHCFPPGSFSSLGQFAYTREVFNLCDDSCLAVTTLL